MQVAHTTAMIMQAYYDIQIMAAANITQIQIEPLIWKIMFIKNALMELFIIPKDNEQGWLANLWKVTDKLLDKTPTVYELQKILTSIAPAKIPTENLLHVSTPAKDLIPLRDHQLVVATTDLPVPRIRSLQDGYRLRLKPEVKLELSTEPKKEKSSRRKSKMVRTPPTLTEGKKKRKKDSSSESSEESEEESSADEDTEKNKAIILGSSSSEDEDFNC